MPQLYPGVLNDDDVRMLAEYFRTDATNSKFAGSPSRRPAARRNGNIYSPGPVFCEKLLLVVFKRLEPSNDF
jgi:hypothetical protein